jgi:hypothetical protein
MSMQLRPICKVHIHTYADQSRVLTDTHALDWALFMAWNAGQNSTASVSSTNTLVKPAGSTCRY